MKLSLILAAALGAGTALPAQNCGNTSVGFTPLNDLGAGSYQGFPGGLYPGGANVLPAAHLAAGLAQAALVVPRDAAGAPDPASGKIVLLSIGMSNTSIEFNAFLPKANASPVKDAKVVVVNGAQGGQSAEIIVDPGARFWSVIDQRLAQAGCTPEQVQAIWFKEANKGPTASFPSHAQTLQGQFAAIMHILRSRYPNARLCYLSSRIYAGYALTALNPEPYAYESAFSVKWLIEQQINGDPQLNFDPAQGVVNAPWLAWGPYTWADGLTPRSDGLIWECDDFNSDGTHPSAKGAGKVADMLLDFFEQDVTATEWFVGPGGGQVLTLQVQDLHRGLPAMARVLDATPGETVHFLDSLAGGGAGPCYPQLGGLCVDLLSPVALLGSAVADGFGRATLTFTVPPASPLVNAYFQAVAQRGPGGADSVKSNAVVRPILP